MKREWVITIETTDEGKVSIRSESWQPEGPLTEREKEMLSRFLAPFVTKE